MKNIPAERIGTLAVLATMPLHALWPVGAHYGASLMPQIRFLTILTFVSGFLYLFSGILRGKLHELKKRGYWRDLLLYTLFIAVIPYGLVTYATRYSSGINTAIFTQSEMIFAAIMGYFLLGERIHGNRLYGMLCIFLANVALLFEGGLEQTGWAEWVLLLTPMLFVYGNMVGKRLIQKLDWSTILIFRSFLGGTILLLISLAIEGPGLPEKSMWFFLFWFSILGFSVTKICWQIALKHVDLSKMTAIIMTAPALSFVFAVLWLKEVPSSAQLFGIALTIAGMIFLLRSPSTSIMEAVERD